MTQDGVHRLEVRPHHIHYEQGDRRVLMVEPAMTWGSRWICKYFHYEPMVMSADSLADGTPDAGLAWT